MNILDIIILVGVVLGMWQGYRKGALVEAARLIGLVLAFLLAVQLMDSIGLTLASGLGLSENIAPLVGFIGVFILVYLAVTFAAKLIEKLLKTLKLGFVNDIVGALAGGFKAALVLSILLLVGRQFGLPGEETRASSALHGSVEYLAETTWDTVSKGLPEARRLSEKFGGTVQEALEDSEDV